MNATPLQNAVQIEAMDIFNRILQREIVAREKLMGQPGIALQLTKIKLKVNQLFDETRRKSAGE